MVATRIVIIINSKAKIKALKIHQLSHMNSRESLYTKRRMQDIVAMAVIIDATIRKVTYIELIRSGCIVAVIGEAILDWKRG